MNELLPIFLVLVVMVILMVAARRPTDKKQCPECGAQCGLDDDVCKHCGYAFSVA